MKVRLNHIRFFAFCVLVHLSFHSFANREGDSLIKILNDKMPIGTFKVDLLNHIAESLMNENHKSAISNANEALALATKIGYKNGIFKSNYILGLLHTNYTLSFNKAIAYFINAQKFSDKNDWHQQLDVLNQMAFINKRKDNYEKSIDYYTKAIQIAEDNNALKKVSSLNGYLSEVYEASGDNEKTLQCLEKILEIEKNTKFKNTEPAALISIAHYYELQKQFGPAETYLLDAIKIFKKTSNHRWTSYSNYLLAKLSMEKQDYKAGIKYAMDGLEEANEYGLPKEIADNHYILSELYDLMRDYKNAYQHYKALKTIDDSLFNIDKINEIKNAELVYESLIKEEQLEKLEAENKLSETKLRKTQILIIAVSILMVMGMVLSIVFYRNYRVKQKVNNELRNRNEFKKLKIDEIIKKLNIEIAEHCQTKSKLEVINSELNNFMYKSSHDLKAPLASIVGLTNMAQGNVNDKERMEYLAMILSSTSRLSTFIDELTQATLVTHANIEASLIHVKGFINEIINDLKNSDNFQGVEIIINADENLEFITDKKLLKTILHNLIENGIKYKNTENNNPYVNISVERTGNLLKLWIKDNGLGIANEHQPKIFDMFYRANTQTQGSGLGLYLVKKSVIKLAGLISVSSKKSEGSTFELTIPETINSQTKDSILNQLIF